MSSHPSASQSNQAFTLAGWTVSPSDHSLTLDNHDAVVIRPKVMKLLQTLAHAEGETLSREQLIEQVWQGNQYVGDRGLTDAIWQLRKTLDTDTEHAPYIETIPKTGYRLLYCAEYRQCPTARPGLTAATSKKKWLLATAILFVALFISWFIQQIRLPEQPAAMLTPTPLTQQAGHETNPRISPDGKRLVYSYMPTSRESRLQILDLSATNATPIEVNAAGGNLTGYAHWSPDSNALMFITSKGENDCEIKQLSLAKRIESAIATCNRQHIAGLSWSSDGEYLSYADQLPDNENPGIVLLELATGEKNQLTQNNTGVSRGEYDNQFAPDGKRIAFIRTKGVANQDIFVVDMQGNEQQVTDIRSALMGLTWKNNTQIIFSKLVNNRATLHLADLENGQITDLPINESNAAFPHYSSKSDTLVYSHRSFSKRLFTVDLKPKDNQARVRPLFRFDAVDSYPAYSAAAKKIAYITDRSGQEEIWIGDNTGKNLRQLTQLETDIFSPSWSPDGRKIAFTASDQIQKYKQIYVFDLDLNTLSQLTTAQRDHAPPNWSNDGQYIYTAVNEDGQFYVWQFDLQGNGSKVIASPSIYAIESPDSRFLYFTDLNRNGIFEFDLSTKTSRKLIETNSVSDGSNFAVSDEGIYYVARSEDQDLLNFYVFETRAHSTVIALPASTIVPYQNITYNSDNEQLIIVQRFSHDADLYFVKGLR